MAVICFFTAVNRSKAAAATFVMSPELTMLPCTSQLIRSYSVISKLRGSEGFTGLPTCRCNVLSNLTHHASTSLPKPQHEQAVKLLSAAVAKLPAGCIAWFSLATAHGRAGAQDAAALCFLKAHHLFSQSDDPKVPHNQPVNCFLTFYGFSH